MCPRESKVINRCSCAQRWSDCRVMLQQPTETHLAWLRLSNQAPTQLGRSRRDDKASISLRAGICSTFISDLIATRRPKAPSWSGCEDMARRRSSRRMWLVTRGELDTSTLNRRARVETIFEFWCTELRHGDVASAPPRHERHHMQSSGMSIDFPSPFLRGGVHSPQPRRMATICDARPCLIVGKHDGRLGEEVETANLPLPE